MREGDRAPEECKDSRGNWTKWVLERCTEAERKAYDQLEEMCSQNEITDSLTVNHKLRFLAGWYFDVPNAF